MSTKGPICVCTERAASAREVGCSYRWDDEAIQICDCAWNGFAHLGEPPPA